MKLWTLFTTLAAALALGLTAQAATSPTGNSVANSLHNLNNLGGAGAGDKYGTTQVCLPCHTPHQMPDKTVGVLWNHSLQPAASYKLFSSSAGIPVTVAGVTTNTIDEVSRKCLGCHDGTIAIDSYGSHNGTLGTINPGYVIGGGGDLTHDHPIDVLYNSASSYSVISVNDKNGKTPTDPAWIATYGTSWASTSKNDPSLMTITGYTSSKWGAKPYSVTALSTLGFYKPTGLTTSVTGTVNGASQTVSTSALYVNCRTCHDPHNNYYSFLRFPNDNSQMCLTCHNK